MSKKKPKKEAPLHIEATLNLTDNEDQCLVELTSLDGRPLTPQVILDAVADMLTAKYGMTSEDWDFPDEGLDS